MNVFSRSAAGAVILVLVTGCGVPNPIPGPIDVLGTTLETVGNTLEAGCKAGRVCTPDCPDGQTYDRDARACVFE